MEIDKDNTCDIMTLLFNTHTLNISSIKLPGGTPPPPPQLTGREVGGEVERKGGREEVEGERAIREFVEEGKREKEGGIGSVRGWKG